MRRTYPPLAPLWLESPTVESIAQGLGARGLPTLHALDREAATIMNALPSDAARARVLDPRYFEDFEILPTIRELVQQVGRAARAAGVPPEGMEVLLQQARLALFHTICWRSYGRRVYVLDAMTFELLVRTELPAIPDALLTIPVPSFYLVVPPGALAFRSRSDEGRAYSIHGITVTTAGPVDEGSHAAGLHGYADAAPRGEPRRQRSSEGTFLESTLDLAQGRTIAEAGDAVAAAEIELASELEDDGSVALGTIGKLILGFCLYLMSEHPALEPVPPPPRADTSRLRNRGKQRKAEQRAAKMSRLGYVYVGRPERAPSSGSGDAEEGAEAPRTRRSLTRQVWVRGYFRDQPVGRGLASRKLVWVRPHLKGPDYAEGLSVTGGYVQPARLR